MTYDNIKPEPPCCKAHVMPELIRHDIGRNHLWLGFKLYKIAMTNDLS